MSLYDKEHVLKAMQGRFLDFYGQFTALEKAGGEWRGPCPIHGGDDPNCTVNPDTGEWFCHSQCQEGGDVFQFLQKKEGLRFGDAVLRLAEWAGAAPMPEPPPPRVVATYDYTDEDGTLLYQVLRREPGARGRAKDFRQCRPDGKGGVEWSLGGVRRVLYRLPEVVTAVAAGQPVYVCGGEKVADALRAQGVVTTTNSGGEGKWDGGLTESLCGANVVILPDNDDPGRRHAHVVAKALHGRAKRVRIVELPGLPPKGDAVEWIVAGGTKEALVALVRATPDWTPEQAPPEPVTPETKATPLRRKTIAERVISAREVGPPPSELPYLWGPYLNVGASHWLTGATGIGKSTLVYNLIGALTEGTTLWDIPCSPIQVLYMDMESGDVGRSLKMSRLYRDKLPPENWLFLREPLRLPEELPDFLAYVQAQAVNLVIFDTARRCFTVRDENDNAEVYNRVVPTLDALKRIGVATLTLGHPAKNGGTSARGAGAQEDAGDVNLSLTMHRGEISAPDGVIALRVTKNRLLGLGVAPLYLKRVGDDHFERLDEGSASGASEPLSAALKAREWLLDYLDGAGGIPASFADIKEAGKLAGHSQTTLFRTIQQMTSEGDVTRPSGGGYVVTDPFAEPET